MTNICTNLIFNFDNLQNKRQIKVKGKTYYIKDFNRIFVKNYIKIYLVRTFLNLEKKKNKKKTNNRK